MRFYAFYDSFCILSLAVKTNKNKDKWLVFLLYKTQKGHAKKHNLHEIKKRYNLMKR